MKKTLSLLALFTLTASIAFALTPTDSPQSLVSGTEVMAQVSVADILGTTPFWQKQSISFFCEAPSSSGPYPCTVDIHCLAYNLGPNAFCHNPAGGDCAGQCTC